MWIHWIARFQIVIYLFIEQESAEVPYSLQSSNLESAAISATIMYFRLGIYEHLCWDFLLLGLFTSSYFFPLMLLKCFIFLFFVAFNYKFNVIYEVSLFMRR